MLPIQILLRHSIDYAGLFPPAGLDLSSTVTNYAEYHSGPEAWALGRLIVPANRLHELGHTISGIRGLETEPWHIAALAGPDLVADLDHIAAFNRRTAGQAAGALVDTIELKAVSVGEVERAMARMPRNLQAYLEIPIAQDPAELIAAIRQSGGRGKVRTGGVTSDAFPTTTNLVRFIRASVGAGLPFKATAGLHHPFRAEYRLTYQPDSPKGTMFGFLNLFLATVFALDKLEDSELHQVLEEKSPAAIQVESEGISWRGHTLDQNALRRAREEAIISFGSCSFTEPIGELQALNLLEFRVPQA